MKNEEAKNKELKNKNKKEKSVLMKKFLLPYAIFLAFIYVSVTFLYTPKYRDEFIVELQAETISLNAEVSKWISSLDGYINSSIAYISTSSNYAAMRDYFKSIANNNHEILDIYFGSAMSYKDGGVFIDTLGDLPPDYDQTKREWYVKAIAKKGIVITNPYKDVATGVTVITISSSVYKNNGELFGVVAMDMSIDNISNMMNSKISNGMNFCIIDKDSGFYVTNPNADLIMNEKHSLYSISEISKLKNDIKSKDFVVNVGKKNWHILQTVNNTNWLIAGYGENTSLAKKLTLLMIILIVVISVLMLMQVILVVLIVSPLSNSLEQAIQNIKSMSIGNFTARFDEKVLVKNDQTGLLAKSIDTMQKSIGTVIYKLQHAVDSINSSTSTISDGNNILSNKASSQAASLEELASSIEEVSATLRETASNALSAKTISAKAQTSTQGGVQAVLATSNNMKEIADSSRKVSDITKIIESIAFQTNILALNAAVEAARAGEQGRGFAVVASEVRNLAQTVSVAAKDISNIVEDTVQKVEIGNKSVLELERLLVEIEKSVDDVLKVLIEISNAVVLEEDSINQINQAVIELNNITQENSSLAEQSAMASINVFEKTEDMVKDISYFKFKEKN